MCCVVFRRARGCFNRLCDAAPYFSFFFSQTRWTPEGRTLKTNGAESSVLVVSDRELMARRASGWSGASTCGQLVAGQLFIPLPFSLSSSSLMRSHCFRFAELRVVPIVSDLAPMCRLLRSVTVGVVLAARLPNPARQIWSSTFHPGSALTLLLCCCYFAAAHLRDRPFTFSL